MRQHWRAGAGTLALVIAAAFGRADEATAVKALKSAGGQILVDDKQPQKPVVGVILWGARFKAAHLKELKDLKSLQKLRIGGPWITDEALKDLHEIKTLQILEVRSPRVSDAGLKKLKEALPKLKIKRASPGETPFADSK
jgi:hypothetical protein